MMEKIKKYYTRINDDFGVLSILWNDLIFAVLIFVFQLSGWNAFLFSKALIPTLVVLSFLLVFFIIFLKPKKAFFSKAVNQIDYFLLSLEIILLILTLTFSPFYPSLNYEMRFSNLTLDKLGWQNGPLALTAHSPNFIIFCSSFLLFVIPVFFTFFRINITSKASLSSSIETKRPSITIKEASDINNLPGKLENLFLSDSPLSEDYLNETEKISHFYSEIKQYISNNLFASVNFGITGHYGSGKTTFYNNVQAKLKREDVNKQIIWIDDFDVWQYKDEQAVLSGMIDRILKAVLISSNPQKIKQKAERISDSYFSKKTGNIADLFDFGEHYTKLITQANDILTSDNKTVVFQIDNIDRGKQSMVTFVYKAIASILKFQKIIYVCLYDETLVKKAFESEKLPENFLDKVISYKINLDTIDKVTALLLEESILKNIQKKYNCDSTAIEAFGKCLVYLPTIRDFIIFVNNNKIVLNPYFYLCPLDYLLLSIIRQKCIDLYEIIYKNKPAFVSIDSLADSVEALLPEALPIAENDASIFEKIEREKQYEPYLPILARLFSRFDSYYYKNSPNHQPPKKDLADSNNNYIEESYSFYFYFTMNESSFSFRNRMLSEDINEVHKYPTLIKKLSDSFYDFFFKDKGVDNECQAQGLFRKHIAEITKQDAPFYIDFFLTNFGLFSSDLLSNKVQDDCCQEIAMLFEKLDFDDSKKIIDMHMHQCNLLYAFKKTADFLHDNNNEKERKLAQYIEKATQEVKKEILEKGINIFCKENYYYKTSQLLSEHLQSNELFSYLEKVLNKENVYPFLKDCLVSENFGSTYQYSLGKEMLSSPQIMDLVSSLLTKEELTEDEKKLKEMFTVLKAKGSSNSLPTYTSPQAFNDLSVLK